MSDEMDLDALIATAKCENPKLFAVAEKEVKAFLYDFLVLPQKELHQSTASPWISVEDRLPKKHQVVFVISSGEHADVNRLDGSGKFQDASEQFPITHWMPIPDSPEVS